MPVKKPRKGYHGAFISLKEDKETKTLLFTNYQKIQVPKKDYKTGQVIPGKMVTKYRFQVYDMTTYDPNNPPQQQFGSVEEKKQIKYCIS